MLMMSALAVTPGTAGASTVVASQVAFGSHAAQAVDEGRPVSFSLVRTWSPGRAPDVTVRIAAANDATRWPAGLGTPTAAPGDPCRPSQRGDAPAQVEFNDQTTPTSQTCTLTVPLPDDDHAPAPDRTVDLGLQTDDGSVTLDNDPFSFAINDIDPVAAFDMPMPSTAAEGVPLTVPVKRSGGMSRALAVDYDVVDSVAGITSSTVHFAAGQSTSEIRVTPAADQIFTPGRTLNVALANGARTADIPVVDDDANVHMAVSQITVDRSAGVAVVTVQRDGNTAPAAAVPYAVDAVSAHPGVDYADGAGIAYFAAGAATTAISIRLIGDPVSEPRSFTVGIHDPFAFSLTSTLNSIAPTTTRVTIAGNPVADRRPADADHPGTATTPTPTDTGDHRVAPEPAPAIAVSSTLLTRDGAAGRPYVALPARRTAALLKVLVTNASARALPAGTMLHLATTGLKLSGASDLALPALAPGAAATMTAKVKISGRTVTVAATASGGVAVSGTRLSLALATHRITLDHPGPIAHSADARLDRTTRFSGTFSSPTCAGTVRLRYRLTNTGWGAAPALLKVTPGAGVCEFSGSQRWVKAIFRYKNLIVQAQHTGEAGAKWSKSVTIRIQR